MARVLLFADLHAHGYKEFSVPVEYRGVILPSRLVDALKVLRAADRSIEASNVSAVVFAGDLFHRKGIVDVPVYGAVAEALWRLSKKAPLYLIPGNHDLVTELQHAISPFRRYRGVKVIDKAQVVPELGMLGCIPYTTSRDSFLISLAALRREKMKWIVAHVGIAGAVSGLGFQPAEEIQLDDIPDLPFYSGHYHKPQSLRQSPPVEYIGAPLEIRRGDGKAQRGYLLIDTDEPDKFTRVFLPHPRFVQVLNGKFNGAKNNFVDVLIDEDADLTEVYTAYMSAGARGVNLVPLPRKPLAHLRLKVGHKKGSFPTLDELIDAYVDHAVTNLDRDKLKEYGRELLNRGV